MLPTGKPVFKHDCDTCRFIGNIAVNNNNGTFLADAYVCGNTIVVRTSDIDDSYMSMDVTDMLYALTADRGDSPLYNVLASLFNEGKVKISIEE